MLKSDFHHQFWVTKKTVQRKLGSKEDECIISSDAELDSKIDLLKSVTESCSQLQRIIDNYQEKVCVLAQEETAVGVFLKETGKCSATSNKIMCCAGKAISYSGQQHMKLRTPLVRLQHEIETFNGRAIKDTYATVQAMERERTEYRAALGWMKSASAQLDPDKGRGMDKFRSAQMHVRAAKSKFDTRTLDCLQKIDLLAAARCNMFSHVLVAYQTAQVDYSTKTHYTFRAALKILEEKTHYNFTILKDLTQQPSVPDQLNKSEMSPIDFDQMLFFKEEYEDQEPSQEASSNKPNEDAVKSEKADKAKSSEAKKTDPKQKSHVDDLLNIDPVGSNIDNPSNVDLLLNLVDDDHDVSKNVTPPATESKAKSALNNFKFDLFGKLQNSSIASSNAPTSAKSEKKKSKNDKVNSAWFDLFADLDPLANPTSMEQKISGDNKNCLEA